MMQFYFRFWFLYGNGNQICIYNIHASLLVAITIDSILNVFNNTLIYFKHLYKYYII